jgi:hypothetical protein
MSTGRRRKEDGNSYNTKTQHNDSKILFICQKSLIIPIGVKFTGRRHKNICIIHTTLHKKNIKNNFVKEICTHSILSIINSKYDGILIQTFGLLV